MPKEGTKVAYSGMGECGLVMGDEGKVLATDYATSTCHVMWHTGAAEHQVIAVYDFDLTVLSDRLDEFDNALDSGLATGFSVRAAYDNGGTAGVVEEMAVHGHLASCAQYAEEAIGLAIQRVRNDPSFQVLSAQLDESEAERVYRTASISLIREALEGDTDE